MALRLQAEVIRGEIDNRTRGRVTGRIWFVGREEPVRLRLQGDAFRDLAGHCLWFSNPAPQAGKAELLADLQEGVAGDMTASRKVRVPECSVEEMLARAKMGLSYPWHWENGLYLEWFSEQNGRVVIETTQFELRLPPEPAWSMTEGEEGEQQNANTRNLNGFMQGLVPSDGSLEDDACDEDAPQSEAEARADAEAARMDLLLERISARLDREQSDEPDFETIYAEERERLCKERGEPEEPPLTPEEEAERQERIAEWNAAAEEVSREMERERWKGGDAFEEHTHPLAQKCQEYALSISREVRRAGWIPENAQSEHPLVEIVNGTMFASAKLAGALNGGDEWPPEPLFAGDCLVRLKKARNYLRDVLRALDGADEDNLSTPPWRARARRESGEILSAVHVMIGQVRDRLADADSAE